MLLNPLNIKLPKEIELLEIWNNLVEDYYMSSNRTDYEIKLRNIKQSEVLRNKITTCVAAILLFKMNSNVEEAKDTLLYFGYDLDKIDIKEVERRIRRENSSLNLLDKNSVSDVKKEEVNFWRMVARLEEANGRDIDVDKMTLAHFLEKVKIIKEKVKEKNKNGRNK